MTVTTQEDTQRTSYSITAQQIEQLNNVYLPKGNERNDFEIAKTVAKAILEKWKESNDQDKNPSIMVPRETYLILEKHAGDTALSGS